MPSEAEWEKAAKGGLQMPVKQSEWQKRNARNQSAVRRVLRGGAFNRNDDLVRCAARCDFTPDGSNNLIGFRVVLCPPYL